MMDEPATRGPRGFRSQVIVELPLVQALNRLGSSLMAGGGFPDRRATHSPFKPS